ncbi:hypothetical Protein YC6258_03971 [Gynuella sunshinyii YC6258]|uniref:Uncharacterized protein n=1 Tax=Gynuella sunshinyii YC6258 TaxID=1445510 RepID=A0A0C5VMQ1_9GAMM|nr:hypothetical Protein YC6258_03971 [Gynuella sunshinyii YC6258]
MIQTGTTGSEHLHATYRADESADTLAGWIIAVQKTICMDQRPLRSAFICFRIF